MTLEQLKRFVEPLNSRIKNIFARGVIKGTTDTKKIQESQASFMADEVKDGMERFQNYGMTSCPQDGAEAIAIFHSGDRAHGIIIAVDDRRYRLKPLEKGEVAIYDDQGQKIHLKRNNEIHISTPGKLTIDAAEEVVVNTVEATINTTTANVNAEESANVEAPEVNIIAETQVTITTPLLEVSGLISCAGIGAGGAPVAGAVTAGEVVASGNVSDASGHMQEMRDAYNGHAHLPAVTPQMT